MNEFVRVSNYRVQLSLKFNDPIYKYRVEAETIPELGQTAEIPVDRSNFVK